MVQTLSGSLEGRPDIFRFLRGQSGHRTRHARAARRVLRTHPPLSATAAIAC